MTRSYAYYPGCSALKSAIELDVATRKLMQALEISWTNLSDAACCGSRECGGLRVEDDLFAVANNARTLAMAEAAQSDTILNVCSTCQLELAGDNLRLQQDAELKRRVNQALETIGLRYEGSLDVKHLLYVLVDDIGLDTLIRAVKRPLDGLRIAPFYGCHLLRPTKVHGEREDPYRPTALGDLIRALGGTEVEYSGATRCCGFHSIIVSKEPQLRMSGGHLMEAKQAGADLIVTPCPLCHTVLDSYQPDIEQVLQKQIALPVLHLPQMVGLALGLSPQDLAIGRHVVDVRPTLQRKTTAAA